MKWFTHLKDSLKAGTNDKKTKIILILFLVGALLMLLPSSHKKQTSTEASVNMMNQVNPTPKELEKLLSQLTGQKVKVLLSYADSGEIEVIREEKIASETSQNAVNYEKESTPVFDSNKNMLIKKQQQPKIKGVCIFYFGPYDESVERALCRGAASALGAKLHTVEVVFQP